MIPYLLLAVVPLTCFVLINLQRSNYRIYNEDKTKRTFLIVCGIVLFLMIALRNKHNGSTDSLNYYNCWNILQKASFEGFLDFMNDSGKEYGFYFSVWVLSKFFYDPQFVFVLSGALFSVSVCRFIYKNCEDIVLGMHLYITLGLYVFMVQGLRQAVAMSICLFSIEFVKKRKLIPFALIVLLAMQFHQSAIVFLIVYFLYGLKLNALTGLGFTFGCGVLIVASDTLVALGNDVFDREYGGTVDSGGFVAVAIYALVLLAALLFAKNKSRDKNFCFFFYLTTLGFVFYLMRYFGALAVERISFYFMFGQLAVLPSAFNSATSQDRKILKLAAYILSFLLFAYRLNNSDLIPYKFFWQ